jgi:hypothetical protein
MRLPPERPNGQRGGIGPYVVISAEGNLTVASVFKIHGDFHFEVSTDQGYPEMCLTANGSMSLDPVEATTVSGTLFIGREGIYGVLQLGRSLGFGSLSLMGAAQLEVNSFNRDLLSDRYKFDYVNRRVTNQIEQVSIEYLARSEFTSPASWVLRDSFEFEGLGRLALTTPTFTTLFV